MLTGLVELAIIVVTHKGTEDQGIKGIRGRGSSSRPLSPVVLDASSSTPHPHPRPRPRLRPQHAAEMWNLWRAWSGTEGQLLVLVAVGAPLGESSITPGQTCPSKWHHHWILACTRLRRDGRRRSSSGEYGLLVWTAVARVRYILLYLNLNWIPGHAGWSATLELRRRSAEFPEEKGEEKKALSASLTVGRQPTINLLQPAAVVLPGCASKSSMACRTHRHDRPQG